MYGEPYFVAINRWKLYKDYDLVLNRLQLLETVCTLFTKFASEKNTYLFSVVTASPSIIMESLLPETFPTYGIELIAEGDRKVYELLRSKYACELFKLGGLYFQEQLLFLIAGVNKTVLTSSNADNRRAIIQVLNTILRLSESTGISHITCQPVSPQCASTAPVFIFPTTELNSTNGRRLLHYLTHSLEGSREVAAASADQHNFGSAFSLKQPLEAGTSAAAAMGSSRYQSRSAGRLQGFSAKLTRVCLETGSSSSGSPPSIRVKRSRPSASPPPPSTYHLVPRIKWSTEHYSVGTGVAALRSSLVSDSSVGMNALLSRAWCTSPSSTSSSSTFIPPLGATELRGTVVAHSVRTSEGLREEIYRIQWTDRTLEMEVYTATQLNSAVALLDRLEGWVSAHPMIGSLVAGLFTTTRPVTQSQNGPNTPYHTFRTLCTDAPAGGPQAASTCSGSNKRPPAAHRRVDRLQVGRSKVLYAGVVTKYLPASRSGGRSTQDQLYHVEWCDGDRADLDQKELQEAVALYAQHKLAFEGLQ